MEALGVLQDSDMEVGAGVSSEHGGPGGKVVAEGDRDVVLNHGL